MVHDRAPGLFVPVFYILSTSRTSDSYWDMMHFVVQATDQQLEPSEIVCDFEAALMDSLQTQFPNAIVLGCLFHLKQALRRAMKRYSIFEEECIIAMSRDVLDTLTVIDPAHVARGIKWVKREIKLRCAQAGVDFITAKWSLECFGMDNELIARTFREIQPRAEFKVSYSAPSMATFVTVIKTISAEYVRRVSDVPRRRTRRVTRENIVLPQAVDIPPDVDSDIDEAEKPPSHANTSVSL